ncbi:MAG: hypothetical protein ACHQCI_05140 [Solirubrobacterales bacterium]|jgi:amino acid transporter
MEAHNRTVAAAQERRRDRFGGVNWGAAFFGWLVAVGMAVLLTALLSAAGAAVAISEIDSPGEAISSADTVSVIGGIGLVLIALVSYFAGGYVAGRMSRFDGGRQGLSVWIWALVVTVVLALLGVIAGEEWNLFAGLDLPRLPIDEDTTAGGIIVLALVLVGTVLAAVAGGKAGERYHRRVDRAGYDRVDDERLARDYEDRTGYAGRVERTA